MDPEVRLTGNESGEECMIDEQFGAKDRETRAVLSTMVLQVPLLHVCLLSSEEHLFMNLIIQSRGKHINIKLSKFCMNFVKDCFV